MFNHQLLNSCKFFQLSKVLVTQASVLTFKYQCDVVYSKFKKPKSGIWLLELFSRFWEGLFKAYFIKSKSIIYRLNGEIRFQFIKVKNLFLFISKKWHVDGWLFMERVKSTLKILSRIWIFSDVKLIWLLKDRVGFIRLSIRNIYLFLRYTINATVVDLYNFISF